MSDKRYEANIIRTTAVEPANNLETTSAPGVWSLDEVMELQKKDKWPTVGNVVSDVDDVFSTFLWPGAGASATAVNNGIDLSTEGGMVWIKAEQTGSGHFHHLVDSARGQSSGFYKALCSTEQKQKTHIHLQLMVVFHLLIQMDLRLVRVLTVIIF